MHRARTRAPMTKTGPASLSRSGRFRYSTSSQADFAQPPQMWLVPPGDCTSEPTSRPGRPQYEQQTSAASMHDEAGAAYGFKGSLGLGNLELHNFPLHRHRIVPAARAPFDPAIARWIAVARIELGLQDQLGRARHRAAFGPPLDRFQIAADRAEHPGHAPGAQRAD